MNEVSSKFTTKVGKRCNNVFQKEREMITKMKKLSTCDYLSIT